MGWCAIAKANRWQVVEFEEAAKKLEMADGFLRSAALQLTDCKNLFYNLVKTNIFDCEWTSEDVKKYCSDIDFGEIPTDNDNRTAWVSVKTFIELCLKLEVGILFC